MKPAARNERPKTTPPDSRLKKASAVLEKMTVPNSARTIDGVPAIISTVDSTMRASAKGRPNSLSQTAIATPSGRAIAIPIRPTRRVPTRGSRKPPVSDSLKPVFGALVSSSGRTYLIPWTSM
jgi:hypothetical protein